MSNHIKKIREEILGITQNEFAKALRRHPSTIYKWEKNESVPHPETLEKIQALVIKKEKEDKKNKHTKTVEL